ncbi:MAG: 3-isopropylmalate dehydratase small subunit, partial [Clostridiales bacterium]|nr:3-isopropylmalate dehydratase small subunit [Clostridiales bacterium]
AINIGLPVIVSKDLYDAVSEGDEMELSLTDGVATVGGREFVCTKLPPYMQGILDQGGLIASLNR